ncbi:MAG TPA: hypothetical protein VGJ05_16955 [Fimbriiglobus sp.]|jgi:hypothetical protein
MRNVLLVGSVVVVVVLAFAGPATAQSPAFKPIDTTKFVVNPANTTADASSFSIRYIGKVIANTIENNGVVRTLNNLLGKPAAPAPTQPGFSSYPNPTSYPSTQYQSVIKPVLPQMSNFGQTPVINK